MSENPAVVIVVGSVNMDLVFTGIPVLPTPGQTVSSESFVVKPGGKGANQASAAARLGATVEFIAAIGNDDLGDQAYADLEKTGIRLDNLVRVDASTGVAAVLIEDSGENIVIVTPGANGTLKAEDVATIAATFTHTHAVVLACLEVPVDVVTAWSQIAAERGWTFILNPAPAPSEALPAELLANTSVITPNETELAALAAGATYEQAVAGLHAAGVGTVVVTRGGDGADLFVDGRNLHHQPAYPATPVDTTGAGDAFNGALAASLASGNPMLEALSIAAAAGALSTRRVGARDALATASEVAELRAR